MSNKHFIDIASPNGAGKSTTSKRILEEFERYISTAFKLGKNIAYETNLHINSHFIRNSKVRELAYTTTLIFFLINSPDICERRVALRVKDGGHFN